MPPDPTSGTWIARIRVDIVLHDCKTIDDARYKLAQTLNDLFSNTDRFDDLDDRNDVDIDIKPF